MATDMETTGAEQTAFVKGNKSFCVELKLTFKSALAHACRKETYFCCKKCVQPCNFIHCGFASKNGLRLTRQAWANLHSCLVHIALWSTTQALSPLCGKQSSMLRASCSRNLYRMIYRNLYRIATFIGVVAIDNITHKFVCGTILITVCCFSLREFSKVVTRCILDRHWATLGWTFSSWLRSSACAKAPIVIENTAPIGLDCDAPCASRPYYFARLNYHSARCGWPWPKWQFCVSVKIPGASINRLISSITLRGRC